MSGAHQPIKTVAMHARGAETPTIRSDDVARLAERSSIVQIAGTKSSAQPATSPASEPVSSFIDLQMEARQCVDLDALRFSIVNSTRKLAGFDQAFLIERNIAGVWCVTRASSVSKIDRNAQLVRAIDGWLSHPAHAETLLRGEARLTNIEHEAKLWELRTKTYAFPHALWLPIKTRDGQILAALLALKSENWRPQHSALLIPMADAYGHAWAALAPQVIAPLERAKGLISKLRLTLVLGCLALVAAFIPVPMSALAPSEIVAAEPMLVTAPIDGVIGDIFAAPGTWVERGAPIVKFIDIKLRNDVEVATRNKAVAEARYFKVVQAATATQKDMQELATTQAELSVANAELDYSAELLARSVITAERAGILIYAAKSDWLGKPVAVGERLMEIGNPTNSEIKIELPVSDAIALKIGGNVSLFLDGDPLRSIEGTITRTSYRAVLTAEQQLAFRIYAKFSEVASRRIGVRGVSRVSGESVSLWFYLLRRPISTLRQRIGL